MEAGETVKEGAVRWVDGFVAKEGVTSGCVVFTPGRITVVCTV